MQVSEVCMHHKKHEQYRIAAVYVCVCKLVKCVCITKNPNSIASRLPLYPSMCGNSGEGTAAEKARLPVLQYLGHVHKSLHGLQLASKEYANVAGSTGKMFATTQLLCPADAGHWAHAGQRLTPPSSLSPPITLSFPLWRLWRFEWEDFQIS